MCTSCAFFWKTCAMRHTHTHTSWLPGCSLARFTGSKIAKQRTCAGSHPPQLLMRLMTDDSRACMKNVAIPQIYPFNNSSNTATDCLPATFLVWSSWVGSSSKSQKQQEPKITKCPESTKSTKMTTVRIAERLRMSCHDSMTTQFKLEVMVCAQVCGHTKDPLVMYSSHSKTCNLRAGPQVCRREKSHQPQMKAQWKLWVSFGLPKADKNLER